MEHSVLKGKLKAAGIPALTDEPMRDHTSFCIGGPADLYVLPDTAEKLRASVLLCREAGVSYVLIGNGSNVVFADAGYRGVVIGTTAMAGAPLLVSESEVRCPAGTKLATLCSFACENGLSGVECLWGIPGSVGGAVCMNAGAYGGEVKDTLLSCTCLTSDGEIKTYSVDELALSYRHSRFSDSGETVLDATFRLTPAPQEEIRAKMNDLMGRRREKQPLEYPSAGSVFKRPQGYYAAALIDGCGLKGAAVGGIQVSEKHAGFMINTGGGTCALKTNFTPLGSTYFSSGLVMLQKKTAQGYTHVEDGAAVDYPIAYDKMFDRDYIVQTLASTVFPK